MNNINLESILKALENILSPDNINNFIVSASELGSYYYIKICSLENDKTVLEICFHKKDDKYYLHIDTKHSRNNLSRVEIGELEYSYLYNRYLVVKNIGINLVEKDLKELTSFKLDKAEKKIGIDELEDD